MARKYKWTEVQCGSCLLKYMKRTSSLQGWLGRCNKCSNHAKFANSPDILIAFLESGKATRFQRGHALPRVNPIKFSGINNHNWKGGKPKCLDCDKQLSRYEAKRCNPCARKQFRGVKRPLNVRLKMIQNLPRGSKHHHWKDGATPKRIKQLQSFEHKLWREAIFARDNYTCVLCGVRNGNGYKVVLHPDHIIPYCQRPDLAYDLSNGRTLCRECHRKTPTFGNKALRYNAA